MNIIDTQTRLPTEIRNLISEWKTSDFNWKCNRLLLVKKCTLKKLEYAHLNMHFDHFNYITMEFVYKQTPITKYRSSISKFKTGYFIGSRNKDNEKPIPCCRYCWNTSIRIKRNSYRGTCSCIFPFLNQKKWIKKNNKWIIAFQ